MAGDELKEARLAVLAQQLREAGYSLAFRQCRWVECFVRRGEEYWIGRGADRSSALDDALRKMLPSHLVSARLEAKLAAASGGPPVNVVARPLERAAPALSSDRLRVTEIDLGDAREAVARVEALLAGIEREMADFAAMAPEWQRLRMLRWMCQARALGEAFPASGGVAGGVRRVARILAELGRQFWPGAVPALQASISPDQAIDRRVLRTAVPRTWAEAVGACDALVEHRRHLDLTAGRDAEGWADAAWLGAPPADPDSKTREVLHEIEAVLGVDTSDDVGGLACLDEAGTAVLVRAARALRWLRRSAPSWRWGAALGRLRRAAHALGTRGRALREALDPDTRPATTWRAAAEAAVLSATAPTARDAACSDILAKVAQSPERTVDAVIGSLDALSTPEIAKLLRASPSVTNALRSVAATHADRRVRRRLGDLVAALAAGEHEGAVVRLRVAPARDPEGEAHGGGGMDAALVTRVRAVTTGRRALFVSNRDDDVLAAHLADRLGLAITWCDGSPRRLQAQCSRIGQGSFDMILAATGFQAHATDVALSRAALAAGVPYVRVNRGRLLAVAQAIARTYGLMSPGASASNAMA